MIFRPNNWAIILSAASCCCWNVLLQNDVVDAFAGFFQPRFVATTKTAALDQQPKCSSVSAVAFLQPNRQANVAQNDFCAYASGLLSSSSDDVEEFEFAEEEEEDTEEGEETEEEEAEEVIPIEDDPSDADYTAQKAAVEASIQNCNVLRAVEEYAFGEGSADRLRENMESFLDEQLEKSGVEASKVDELLQTMEVSEDEARTAIDEEKERMQNVDSSRGKGADSGRRQEFISNIGVDSSAFPSDDDPIMVDEEQPSLSLLNDDLVRLQSSISSLVNTTKGYATGDSITNKQALIDVDYELERLDEQTLDEFELVLNASAVDQDGLEYNEFISNEEPMRWLLYDRNFNLTEIMLAACRHNPDSPLLLNHWMPQLCALSKYEDARARNFSFTWEDAAQVDMRELRRYYRGLGYDDVPTMNPAQTNIIEVKAEYDDEIVNMVAFEHWIDEVYNEEEEDLYFDSDEFQPENNVYDFNFGMETSSEVKAFEVEYEDFVTEHKNETQEWRDRYAKEKQYEKVVDEQAVKDFRGCLVVACCGSDQDLEIAEKITAKMAEVHRKQVYVETRVYSHARQSDNVFEMWLEGYDISLIHSKRSALYNSKSWDGPSEIDDEHMGYLVDKVGDLISDDSRYSYNLQEFVTEV